MLYAICFCCFYNTVKLCDTSLTSARPHKSPFYMSACYIAQQDDDHDDDETRRHTRKLFTIKCYYWIIPRHKYLFICLWYVWNRFTNNVCAWRIFENMMGLTWLRWNLAFYQSIINSMFVICSLGVCCICLFASSFPFENRDREWGREKERKCAFHGNHIAEFTRSATRSTIYSGIS